MRNRDILCIALMAALVLGVVGCSDDDDPVAVATTPYFGLTFYEDGGLRKAPTVGAYFSMELVSPLPTVTINGETIESFDVEGHLIWGGVQVPATSAVDWEVRQGDKVVSGSLALPDFPTDVTCNGTSLDPSNSNYLMPAADYAFAWTGGSHDFCSGYFRYEGIDRDDVYQNWSSSTGGVTFALGAGEEPEYLRLTAWNGVEMIPGAVPNATGWANGYVSGLTDSESFRMGLGPVGGADTSEATVREIIRDLHRAVLEP